MMWDQTLRIVSAGRSAFEYGQSLQSGYCGAIGTDMSATRVRGVLRERIHIVGWQKMWE